MDYRYRPLNQRFHKYQWIEVELEPKAANHDQRKDSRRPVLDSIRLVGEPLSTKDDWRERRQILDRLPHRTLKQLEAAYDADKTSLGILRPSRIHDIEITEELGEWKSS